MYSINDTLLIISVTTSTLTAVLNPTVLDLISHKVVATCIEYELNNKMS